MGDHDRARLTTETCPTCKGAGRICRPAPTPPGTADGDMRYDAAEPRRVPGAAAHLPPRR